MLTERNLPTITLQRYKEIFTFPIIEFYRSAGFDCQEYNYNLLVSDYKSAYTAQMQNIQLMPYTESILSEINKKNIKQCIFSASSKQSINSQLLFYNISHYFSEIIALTDDFAFGKYDLAVQWCNHNLINNKDRILIIGDTLHDYEISQKWDLIVYLFPKAIKIYKYIVLYFLANVYLTLQRY